MNASDLLGVLNLLTYHAMIIPIHLYANICLRELLTEEQYIMVRGQHTFQELKPVQIHWPNTQTDLRVFQQ